MKTFSTKPSILERQEVISCPVCKDDKFIDFWDMDREYSYKKCCNCSLIYQNPQPVASDVTSRYDDDYFEYEIENEDSFLNLMILGLKDVDFDFSPVMERKKKILDIGCATGLFLSHMKELGWETYGVEVCKGAAEYGNRVRGVNIFNGTLNEAPIEKESLDVIHLSHVIEHINNPDDFVKDIYSLLKPGGVIYCTTPNISGFQAKLFKDKWRSVIPDHLILFSIKTLKRLFTQNNFKVERHKTWGGLCANSGYHKLIKLLLDRLAKPLGFGDVVIIKAVKPIYIDP